MLCLYWRIIVWFRLGISEYQVKLDLDRREMHQPRQVDDGGRLPAEVEAHHEPQHLLLHHGADHHQCRPPPGKYTPVSLDRMNILFYQTTTFETSDRNYDEGYSLGL